MVAYIPPPKNRSEFHALDPDLPSLAAEVAIDVDNLLAGTSNDQTAMRQLANKLKQSIEDDSNGNLSRARMDMATVTVLGEAVLGTMERQNHRERIEDLLTKANEIALILGSADPKINREGLEEARVFCVALSRAAAAYSESIRDLRPSHPFRR